MLAAHAFLEGGGVELDAGADLGDLEGDGADAGGESFWFEAMGLALAGVGALVGLGLEDGGAFAAHGFIDEDADAFGEAGGALIGEELQHGMEEFRIGLVGHVFVVVGCVCRHPNTRTA